jgi:cold shock CspA family protein
MFGTITSLWPIKNFGFLRDDAGVDRFFHRSGVTPPGRLEELRVGDLVECDPDEHAVKGPRATNVRLSR